MYSGHGLFIGGARRRHGGGWELPVHDPAAGEALGAMPATSAEGIADHLNVKLGQGGPMIENRVKRLWAESKGAVNGWLSIGNGFIAHIMASAGYDPVTADLQHGALDYHAMLAAKATGWSLDLVTVSNDVRLLAGAAEVSVAEVRRRVGEVRFAQSPAQAPAGTGGH